MNPDETSEINKLRQDILSLSARLTRVETALKNISSDSSLRKQITSPAETNEDDLEISFGKPESVEYKVGESGLAWLGNIVLLFGIAFLIQYIKVPLLSALTGYVLIAGLYIASGLSRKTLQHLSNLFGYNAHILLYYNTLRLHFFVDTPVIESATGGLLVLIVVLGVLAYLAYRKQSQFLTSLLLLLTIATGIISNSIPVAACSSAVATIAAVILYRRFAWLKLAFAFIFIIYLSHLNWLLNNPLMGNELKLSEGPGLSYSFFVLTGVIFSLLTLIPKAASVSRDFLLTAIIWNGFLFTIILAISTAMYFSHSYVLLFSLIAAFCLGLSIFIQTRSELKIAAAIYALYSFLAMSVAFYGILALPKAYTLLAAESLLVVSIALWYESRFIVVMNSILFFLLLSLYLLGGPDYSATNFSFMLTAFFTARVINWQKARLKLKTELIRNLYLLVGWIMTLVAINQIAPKSFITASWIFSALVFFATSLLLKNIKYRWLGLASLVASAVRLILIDMSNIDVGFRVLLFLVLAVVTIGASVWYTKYYRQKKTSE